MRPEAERLSLCRDAGVQSPHAEAWDDNIDNQYAPVEAGTSRHCRLRAAFYPGMYKWTGAAIQQQLGYVCRDLKYVDGFIQGGHELDKKYTDILETIRKVYAQQKYMYENDTHKVPDRIVSISQPYVRPVVRGKASKPTEFGAKLHLSIDELGFARIEYLSFDAYNEGPMLIQALEAYKYHHGCYPSRVLVDQIYRTRPNIAFCQKNRIRISGPRLGRPIKDEDIRKKDAQLAAQDNADRIQIERYFSTAKRRNGMGLITKKREDTSLTTIAFSVLVTNIFGSFKLAVEESETEASTTA